MSAYLHKGIYHIMEGMVRRLLSYTCYTAIAIKLS